MRKEIRRTIVICDVCGTVYDDTDVCGRDYFIYDIPNSNFENYRPLDICNDCYQKLLKYLFGREKKNGS